MMRPIGRAGSRVAPQIFGIFRRTYSAPMRGIRMDRALLSVALVFLCAASPSRGAVRVPSIFSDGMVLQTNDESGMRGFVWGWTDQPSEPVRVTLLGQSYNVTSDAQAPHRWAVQLNPHHPAVDAGSMTIEGSDGPSIVIERVSFGDVFLCSGQSNMVFPLNLALNASAEIATAKDFPNFRLFTVAEGTADTEQMDVPAGSVGWVNLNTTNVASFSAVCYMTVRDMIAAHDSKRPVGLVFSAVGGTRVESWMSEEALHGCPQYLPVSGAGTNKPTVLWNAMIAPWIGYNLRAALWYQGEMNAERANSTDYYHCFFEQMITSWRDRWNVGDWPFLFMQLPPSVLASAPPSTETGRPAIRAAQAETLPTPGGDIDTTGMAVTIDLGGVSKWGVDHPPNKNEMSRRLALQLLHVAYAEQAPAVNYSGPLPTTVAMDSASSTISIDFVDWTAVGLHLADVPNCTTCCSGSTPFEVSADGGQHWKSANGTISSSGDHVIISLPSTASASAVTEVRYAWTDFVQCVLKNEYGLVAGPFASKLSAAGPAEELPSVTSSAAPNRTLSAPPLGFNSWNAFHCDVDEQLILDTAELFHTSGLYDVGFRYINIDDCWQVTRYPNGTERPDPARFPSGMKYLAQTVHDKYDLKFGLYTAQHEYTCQKRPGSYKHETLDAATMCDWEVDYLKIDMCGGASWHHLNTSWIKFRVGFDECQSTTGHTIVESVESCGSVTGCGEWVGALADTWRIGSDIQANWDSIMSIIDHDNTLWPLAGPGHYNDADMLQVGNVGLSFVEQRSHFAMWSLLTSPMLIGTNLKTASKATMSILTAAEVVSVNQDSLSVQGRRLASTQAGAWLKETDPYTPVPSGTLEVWGKPLSDGSVAVILLNRGDVAAPITVQFSDLPWLKATTGCKVRDLWARKDLGSASQSYTSGPIESHDNAMLKITCGTLTSADSTV